MHLAFEHPHTQTDLDVILQILVREISRWRLQLHIIVPAFTRCAFCSACRRPFISLTCFAISCSEYQPYTAAQHKFSKASRRSTKRLPTFRSH